jgi:two-component sensor histidine kinase
VSFGKISELSDILWVEIGVRFSELSFYWRCMMASNAVAIARLKVENESGLVIVPISTNKPDIPEPIQQKWQRIVDLVAHIMHVPTGLITRLTTENLEVFVASATAGNPYKNNDKDSLGIGMFCETVAGQRKPLTVQDASTTEFWRKNPHAGLGMHSYSGVPIQWQDGEVFGTFCMLTDKTNQFSEDFQKLILEFKEIIETDLNYILLYEELKKKLSASEMYIREVHHRIKNQFNMLIGYISLQGRDNKIDIQSILSDLQTRIKAISLLHDKLHRKGNLDEPFLHEYIKDLSRIILKDFMDLGVNLKLEIDPIYVSLDISVPIGLIICELISNSLKHAFKKTGNPAIRISFHKLSADRIEMIYADNGIGYPDGFDVDKLDSLGMSLIKMLTTQLRGEMRLSNDGGARFHAEIVSYK